MPRLGLARCPPWTGSVIREAVTPHVMTNGTIKFFDAHKGFGFIETAALDDDVFFHVDDVDGPDPREGQTVEFTVEQAPRGPRATGLTISS